MIELKTTSEIKKMSEACKISAQALKLAGDYMKPGVSGSSLYLPGQSQVSWDTVGFQAARAYQ